MRKNSQFSPMRIVTDLHLIGLLFPENVADDVDGGVRVCARRFHSPAIAVHGVDHQPLPLSPTITVTFARAMRASWVCGDSSARDFRSLCCCSSHMFRNCFDVPLDDSRRSPLAIPPVLIDVSSHTRTDTGISCTWEKSNRVEVHRKPIGRVLIFRS